MAKASRGLSVDRIRDLARSGAETALKQLRAEIIAIERTFPELAQGRKVARKTVQAARKRTRQMSAAARKEVSIRMKKYWVERRKAKAK